jgi:hypothetical protein
MAIIINDNIRVNAGKPVDAKYLSSGNTAYTSVAAVNAAITIPERHVGLTVNIMGVEYWYTGVTSSPIQKKYDSTIPSGDFVTGGTNLGFFSGFTGVQTLPLDYALNPTDYSNGNYYSTYGWYYRGTDGIIYAGTPSDGIPKRAYIKTVAPVKSWIWNEFTGSSNMLGWILIDSNVQNNLGVFVNGVIYYPPAISYTQTSWISGTNPNNGSNVTFDIIAGSLTTGITMTVGAPVFAGKAGKLLEFRTLQTKTPNIISVSYDEAFVYVSGATVHGANIGTGVGIYSGTTNNTLQFKSICGGGNTTVTQIGNNIIISSTGGTGGGGTYDLSSPSVCCVGGMLPNTILTGKTAFELFEEILVPEIFGTLTAPVGSISTSAAPFYEIGCSASFNITGAFNRGCINPQGCSASDKRVGLPSCYTYTGAQIAGAYATVSCSDLRSISTYTILSGTQSWSVQTCYDAGVQPISTKGTPFNFACPAGITPSATISVNGILPWYWGLSTSGIVNGTCIANCGCGVGGAKIVGSATGTLPITFNSSASDFIWFAVPAGTPIKNCWYVNGTNNGCIGGTGNLFCYCSVPIPVTSAEGCWINCNYNVYVSCGATGTAAGVPMCMS